MYNNTFSYSYSATKNKEVENIRRKYIPQEKSKIQVLKSLDLRVQSAGMIEGLSCGIIGTLIFGIGMCFLLDVFAGASWIAAMFMVIGSLVMIPAYAIYKWIAHKTKEELTPEILRLSEEILRLQDQD